MERFLNAFAQDQLRVMEATENRNSKRQHLIDKSCRLQNELEQKLNDRERKLLENLLDTVADQNCCYAEERFIRGYRLGVLMTMEVFSGQDTFL